MYDPAKTAEEQYKGHMEQVQNQQNTIAQNPTLGTKMSNDEMDELYAAIMAETLSGQTGGEVWSKGGYTNNKAAADAAAAAGATVTETKDPATGEEGYYRYTGTRAEDPTKGGAGADSTLMTDEDYAAVQYEKARYADAQSKYQQALAAGNTELASQYKAVMDEAHQNAERIRLRYNYQGGADGSQYLTAGELGVATGSGNGNGSGYGSGYGSGSGDDLSEYLREMYGAMTDSALAELTAAYEKNLAELDRAGVGLEESYRNARNQTVGAAELASKNFYEYAAAHGLNSGTGGQAELARNVTLQGNLNSLNEEEAAAYADLELQRANVETEYNLAVAQAQAEGQYELAAALYEEKIRVQEMVAAQQQALLEQSAAQQEALLAQDTARQESLAAYGDLFLKDGVMPSAEMLSAMGLSEADAAAYIAAQAAGTQAGAKASSGQSSSQKPSLTWAQTKTEIADGNLASSVLAAYKYYMGEDYSAAGQESTLANYLSNPAVQTAKRNIDNGIWGGETLLTAIEAAVGHTISEKEAIAILDYAGL